METRNTLDTGLRTSSRGAAGRRQHPWPVRTMHWINAAAMLVMITSGWGIYDDDVIIRGLHFGKAVRLGDWAAWSLNWHFAGMWFLAPSTVLPTSSTASSPGASGSGCCPYGRATCCKRSVDTLHLKIAHEDLTVYNAVQKLLYIFAILAGVSQVVTGLAIWKPVQFSGLVSLLGGFQTARVIHFARHGGPGGLPARARAVGAAGAADAVGHADRRPAPVARAGREGRRR